MFKGDEKIWLYLVGIVIMFIIIALASRDYILPFIFEGESNPIVNNNQVDPPPFTIDLNQNYFAIVETNKGSIRIDLFENNAPNNVNNFVYLATTKFYENTKFHRLIPGLLIQGGDKNSLDDDLDNDGLGNPGYVIKDEINLDTLSLSKEQRENIINLGYENNTQIISNDIARFSIAMANGGPNSNGSQFFIIISNNSDSRISELNGKFTVIGEVIDGFDTLNSISNTKVDNPSTISPRPFEDIVIESITIENESQ